MRAKTVALLVLDLLAVTSILATTLPLLLGPWGAQLHVPVLVSLHGTVDGARGTLAQRASVPRLPPTVNRVGRGRQHPASD